MAPHIEDWYDGKCQPAGKVYGLQGVEVLTNTTVNSIVLEDDSQGQKVATSVTLSSGETLRMYVLSIPICSTAMHAMRQCYVIKSFRN